MANRTVALKFLRDASVLLVVQRHASVTAHAVAIVNTQPVPKTAGVAIRTVKDRTGTVVVQVTNPAKIARERFVRRITIWIDTAIVGRLKRCAHHTEHFGYCVSIEGFIFPHG